MCVRRVAGLLRAGATVETVTALEFIGLTQGQSPSPPDVPAAKCLPDWLRLADPPRCNRGSEHERLPQLDRGHPRPVEGHLRRA